MTDKSLKRKYRGAQRIAVERQRLQAALKEEDPIVQYWMLKDLDSCQNFNTFPKLVEEAKVAQSKTVKAVRALPGNIWWWTLVDPRKQPQR